MNKKFEQCRTVLFDLDGTLTDSAPGIIASFSYMMERMGLTPPTYAEMLKYVGPPMRENIANLVGPNRIEDGLKHYLHSLIDLDKGIELNRPYDGIIESLDSLKAAGRTLYIATSKRVDMARKIAEHFGFLPRFKEIYGTEPGTGSPSKDALLERLLRAEDLDPAETVMVGDRRHDVDGAKLNGLSCIGVAWGYGSRQELEEAGAEAYVESPSALLSLLLGRS